MGYQTVLNLRDANVARVIVTALKAHGFHPLEGGVDGIPGLPGVTGLDGSAIRVPEAEADDARLLAAALAQDMISGPQG
jgi:hypothetical protein